MKQILLKLICITILTFSASIIGCDMATVRGQSVSGGKLLIVNVINGSANKIKDNGVLLDSIPENESSNKGLKIDRKKKDTKPIKHSSVGEKILGVLLLTLFGTATILTILIIPVYNSLGESFSTGGIAIVVGIAAVFAALSVLAGIYLDRIWKSPKRVKKDKKTASNPGK